MGRSACIALLLACGCGRIGFDERLAPDAGLDDPPAASGFSALIAYGDQTCAIHAGRPYCWGSNGASQLGDGGTTNAGSPTAVNVPAGTATAAAQGETHGCAIVDGTLYCWGEGFAVQPAAVALPAPARAVDAGQDFTCALADRLYCWGDNSSGQLGDNTMAPKVTPNPVMIAGDVIALDAGDDHVCAITTLDVECWGHNDQGAIGTGSFNPAFELLPVDVIGGVTTLPRIAGWHACNLQGGEVRCWGRNTEGELGDGTTDDSPTPVLVPLANVDVIATGGGPSDFDASCAANGGDVKCWGAGVTGRLGDGETADRTSPVDVIGLPGSNVRDLAIGYGHACALLVDGDIWCWGRGEAGQLGNGAFANSLVPVRVTPPSS
jgi:alpha-tubulin suppressor-like RCC1 family protein